MGKCMMGKRGGGKWGGEGEREGREGGEGRRMRGLERKSAAEDAAHAVDGRPPPGEHRTGEQLNGWAGSHSGMPHHLQPDRGTHSNRANAAVC